MLMLFRTKRNIIPKFTVPGLLEAALSLLENVGLQTILTLKNIFTVKCRV
ncbi:hypothetical protein X474_05250 [Dethiosulfatarculus sandiegensis]|uniref:Uncharacterized protein n=1 Tax=Dethiosulfatarculus sandiegensis TaxID=1429043 RepID=A0A0D2HY40_9BACT|nr:hypothetical protein X474_05250 [Dethiosulfatarculus sandiegensis]